jgi:hypothetical protein
VWRACTVVSLLHVGPDLPPRAPYHVRNQLQLLCADENCVDNSSSDRPQDQLGL